MKSQRVKFAQVPVTEEGTCDLPAGAMIVSVDFEDKGGLGSDRRPAAAWIAVPVGDEPTENNGVASIAD
jgi:hypothetical protein